MHYELSWGAVGFGLAVMLVGTLFTIYYKWVADNFGNGIASYDRYKLYGVLACSVGFIIITGVHTLLISWLSSVFFGG